MRRPRNLHKYTSVARAVAMLRIEADRIEKAAEPGEVMRLELQWWRWNESWVPQRKQHSGKEGVQ